MGRNWRNNAGKERRDGTIRAVEVDERALRARRHEAHINVWAPITGEEPMRDACIELLHGSLRAYPIFGLNLMMEMRRGDTEDYLVLVLRGMTTGHLLEGAVRPPFVFSPNLLWKKGIDMKFPTDIHEALVRYLLDQPEMIYARDYVEAQIKAEEQAERKKKADEARAMKEKRGGVLEELRAKQGHVPSATPQDFIELAKRRAAEIGATPGSVPVHDEDEPSETPRKQRGPKIDRPVLEDLKDIQRVSDGIVEHDSCRLLVCRGAPAGGGKFHTVIRFNRVPEGHPMFEAKRLNIAVNQELLHSLDEVEIEEGNERLLVFREAVRYLRAELAKSGVILTRSASGDEPPKSNGNGAHHAPTSEDSEGSEEAAPAS